MEDKIAGNRFVLRPDTMADCRDIFEWLTQSDLTKSILGPPDFPDARVL